MQPRPGLVHWNHAVGCAARTVWHSEVRVAHPPFCFASAGVKKAVIPAKAGIQLAGRTARGAHQRCKPDSGLAWNGDVTVGTVT